MARSRRLAAEQPCQTCGKAFAPRVDSLLSGGGRFCSKKCAACPGLDRVPRAEQVCRACGSSFIAHRSEVARGKALFCSRACARSLRKGIDEVLWSRVDVTPGCWLWTGAINRWFGYGAVRFDGRNWTTHRLAYTACNGPIPDGMCVCHRCDVPACVSPAHLFLGTLADNSADMIAKLRGCHGQKQHMARLTDAAVLEIRAAFGAGASPGDLGRAHGVHHTTIRAVVKGYTWRHLLPDISACREISQPPQLAKDLGKREADRNRSSLDALIRLREDFAAEMGIRLGHRVVGGEG